MTSTDRSESVSDRVLPSSRRPVPGSEEYERNLAAKRSARDGDAGRQRSRSAAEIEADLQAATERLAANVDELASRLNPREVARRGAGRVRGLVTTAEGAPRVEVVGAVVGALVGAAVLIWWSRRRR
jgi:hypothetical protein